MFKLLQALRPNPLYTPGGVDNFWKVQEGDDDDREAANTGEFRIPRNQERVHLSIDTVKGEVMKGSDQVKERKDGESDEVPRDKVASQHWQLATALGGCLHERD